MKKKPETNLEELLNLLGLQSDTRVRCLLEDLLKDTRTWNHVIPRLENQLDIEFLLKTNKDLSLPNLIHSDNIKKLVKQIEERIEDLIEKILCLLEQLGKRVGKDLKKCDPIDRKRLLKLLLALVNLINVKNLLENLDSIGEKRK